MKLFSSDKSGDLFYWEHNPEEYALYKVHISSDYALYTIILAIFAFKAKSQYGKESHSRNHLVATRFH